MKKKILSLILASAIAASAFGMVACGGNDGDNGGEITANTDPATIKSEQVADEAAWKAAFDYTAATGYSARAISQREEDGKVVSASDSTLTRVADKYCIDGTYKNAKYDNETGEYVIENGEYVLETNTSKYFAAVVDGKNYQYSYNDAEKAWYRKETDRDVMQSAGLNFKEYKDAYNGFAKFKFENGAYTASFEEDSENENISYVETYTIKIKNGKIVYFGYDSEFEDTDEEDPETRKSETSIMVFDVGNTTVTLPAEFKDAASDDEE